MATTPRGPRGPRRPKRLAGHQRPAAPVTEPVAEPVEPVVEPSEPSAKPAEAVEAAEAAEVAEPVAEPVEEPVEVDDDEDELDDDEDAEDEDDEDDEEGRDDDPAPRRLPVALLVLALLLVAVVVSEAVYVLTEPESPTTISAERPVVLDPLETDGVVDQAAADVVTIVSGSGDTFDDDLDRAAALMTSDFADSYRDTKADVRERWVAEKVQVTAQVSAQGVVRADSDQVEALLFLTQATTKGNGGPTLAQYRVVATMIDTEDGWLVSKLETF